MDENLRNKLTEVKPVIRSTLLALGGRVSEREFRREYFNNEGESFNVFLYGFGMSFYEFMQQIPDVVRAWKIRTIEGEEVLIERVSTEGSSHMDTLTIVTKKKKKPMSGFRFPASRFNSSLTARQPYSHFSRSTSASGSTGTFFRNNSTNVFKPKFSAAASKPQPSVQSRITNTLRPVPRTASYSQLPPAPHQVLKTILFKANTSRDDKELETKENAKPPVEPLKENAKSPVEPLKENAKPPVEPLKENAKPSVEPLKENAKLPVEPLKENLNSKSNLPLRLTMKTILYKGSGDKSQDEKENLLPRQSSLVQLSKEKMSQSMDSDLWSDDEDDLTTYRTQMAGVAPAKKDSKKPVFKKKAAVSPLRARETNPLEIPQKDERKPEKKIFVAREDKPVISTETQEPKEPRPSLPRISTNNICRSAFADIKKQKVEDEKKLNNNDSNNELENYHTLPFVIPDTRMRELRNQLYFQVELVDFTSPSQFVFRHNHQVLQILTEEMGLHYKNLKESAHLSIRQLLLGMSVAVFFEDMWQRAEVLSVVESNANVLFVDAGYRKWIKVSELRYIEKTFAAVPRKCYKGSLFGVKPSNGDTLWSTAAIMKFMAKTKGKMCLATIKEKKDGFYQLSLVDKAIERTRVGDYLVEMGFAEVVMELDYSKNAVLI